MQVRIKKHILHRAPADPMHPDGALPESRRAVGTVRLCSAAESSRQRIGHRTRHDGLSTRGARAIEDCWATLHSKAHR